MAWLPADELHARDQFSDPENLEQRANRQANEARSMLDAEDPRNPSTIVVAVAWLAAEVRAARGG